MVAHTCRQADKLNPDAKNQLGQHSEKRKEKS